MTGQKAFVCPSCGARTDPSTSICDHCHFLHLGRPRRIAADQTETKTSQDPQRRPTFSYLCPNSNCRVRNLVYNENNNLCFNCGREMFLTKAGREARWYEESGRQARGGGVVVALVGFTLCLVVFLGIPLLVRGIVEMHLSKARREKGREMNREAGRKPLARSARHFGGLSGGEIWVDRGPDAQDRPEQPEFENPKWLKPFAKIFYGLWIVALIVTLMVS